MTAQQILSHVDHTLLKPTATSADIKQLCQEAVEHKVASVCVPPCYVSSISEAFVGLNICTVIGFPLGYSEGYSKYAEAMNAIENGANEVDVVVNISHVKNGYFDKVEAEIAALKRGIGNITMKLIVETCYLTESEKIRLCQIVTNTGTDYIKTSTGLGSAGATIEDIRLFKEHIGANVKMKASGGIRTKEDMVMYLEAGCDRLGTSSAITILGGNNNASSY